jgi:hypothetical protein
VPVNLRSFQRLDPTAVQVTVDRLVMRITRRFPDRNLGSVAAELSGLVGEVSEQSSADRRRNRAIGLACRVAGIAIVAVAFTLAFVTRCQTAAAFAASNGCRSLRAASLTWCTPPSRCTS